MSAKKKKKTLTLRWYSRLSLLLLTKIWYNKMKKILYLSCYLKYKNKEERFIDEKR